MNSYRFGFLVEPTTAPQNTDVAALDRLCKQIGYLYFAGGKGATMSIDARLTVTTGAYVVANATTGNPEVLLSMNSPFRLPGTLMPPQMGATNSGEVIATGSIFAATTCIDDKATTIITGLDRPVVTKGCGIVAYVPAGTDISSELDAQMSIPVCNGQTLVIGTAVQDAMQGTYETPFSSAWAFGIFGGRTLEQVALVSEGSGRITKYRR